MKHFVLSLIATLWLAATSHCQLPNGSYGENYTVTDQFGVQHNLHNYLDDGYTVYFVVFATWTGPAWDYLTSGACDDLYYYHGPAGAPGVSATTTNDVMVIWVDGDLVTTDAELTGGAGSQGNWLNPSGLPTSFPMVNPNSSLTTQILDDYAIAYFPTVYRICTNRIVTEVGQQTAADLYITVSDCPPPASFNNDPLILNYIGETTTCGEHNAAVRIQNLGLNPLTSCSITAFGGISPITSNWTGYLDTYEVADVSVGSVAMSATGNIQVAITSPDDNGSNNSVDAAIAFAPNGTTHIRIDILFDRWPEECSWEITDENGAVVASANYASGTPADNSFLTEDVWVPGAGCYTFTAYDAYGDGLFDAQYGNFSSGTIAVTTVADNGNTFSTVWVYEGDYNYLSASAKVNVFGSTSITGCTDITACNYIATATIDDGTCTYPGCLNPLAINYNPNAGCANNSCICNDHAPIITDNFDNYIISQGLAAQSATWNTWTGSLANDAIVSNNYAFNGTKSVKIEGMTTDLVLPIGPYTSGKYEINFKMLSTSNGGYFNLIHQWSEITTNYEWAFDVFVDGNGTVTWISEGINGGQAYVTPFSWFDVLLLVDLDNDLGSFYLDGNLLTTWQWSINNGNGAPGINALAAMNFFGTNTQNGDGLYYIDAMRVYSYSAITNCNQGQVGCTDINACNYNPVASINDGSCSYDCPPCQDIVGAPFIWSNDFSDPSDWIIAHDGNFNSDFEIGVGLESMGSFGTPAIQSTTANNGYAMYNSDGYNNSAGTFYEQAHITTATPINLAGYSNVILQFETQYRRFSDEQTWLIVSTDGTFPTLDDPMTDISGMPGVFRVWEDGELTQSISPGNPTIRSFNISEIAGNAPQVWIRLQFTGIWGYAWYIDDISISQQFQYDADLSSARLNFTSTELEYGRIPHQLQPSFYNVNCNLTNTGTEQLSNVTLEVSINDTQSNTSVLNEVLLTSATLLPGEELIFNEDILLNDLPIGSYEVTFQLQSAEQGCDGNTTNNIQTKNFSITNVEFGLDSYELFPSDEELLGGLGSNSFTDNSDGFMAMSYYEVVAANTPIYGLQVFLANGTVEGSQLRAAIHDTLNIFSDNISSPVLESDIYTITITDVTNGYAFIPFGFVNYLQTNGYYAAVELFSQNNTFPIRILDVLTVPQPAYASLIYLPSDNVVYSNGNAYAIRMILAEEALSFGCTNPQACNFDITASADDGSCLLPGANCDDGNAATTNDIVQSNCQCVGILFNPGCNNALACNYDPSATFNDGSCLFIGSTCNDLNSSTINDVIQNNCQCAGTPIDPGCTGFSVNNSAVNPTCAGLSNGFISVNATGTSSPFNYNWSNGSTGSNITNLAAGAYSVTISDALGCSETLNFNLAAPQALNAVVSSIPVNCFGASTGSASVNVSGGTAPYSYAWTTSPIQNTAQIFNVAAGNYTVNVTDTNGCVFSTGATISQPTVPLTVSATTTSATCSQNDGTASALVSGNTGAVQYLWSNGQTAATASNLLAGNYTVNITSNGCSAQTSVSVNNTNAPLINHVSSSPQCFGDNTGSISTIITGGTQPYQYLWSNGGSGTSQTGLTAGNYTFIVIDNVGCQASIAVALTQPNPINIALSATPTSCSGTPQGAVNATVSGGTQPYLYSWSNGSGGTGISNLVAGNYTLTLTDASGCITDASSEVINPNGIDAFAIPYNINCIGGSDGSIEIVVTEGTPPFNYEWNNGQAGTSFINNLQEGNYSCNISDANGCSYTVSSSIDAPQGNLPEILGMSNVDPFSLQTYSVGTISGATLTWVVTGGNILSGQGTNFIQVQWSDEPVAAVVLLIFYANGCQASVDLIVQTGNNVDESATQPIWTLFPNPASEMLGMEVMNSQAFLSFTISDALGKTIRTGTLQPGINRLDIVNIASGVYTLSVTTSDNKRQIQRFIKQ